MANSSAVGRGGCPAPFFSDASFGTDGGFIPGRLCQPFGNIRCCLPCPMHEWVYPDNFSTLSTIADWITVVGLACCAFLLLSWLCLPVEKTHRHYLSISLVCGVTLMNLGFLIPMAGRPEQCFDTITPHGMGSSSVCGASGAMLLLGGWSGVMWVFLRSLSLHLQICWQVVVGRSFMWASQLAGWGVPAVAVVIALLLSGVSFRFGATCHINHRNSLADFWIPLLVFAGLTVVIQFATFGYCIRVYLASLADDSTTTEGSTGLPSYSNSMRTMTPRQAYRRVRRVIQLQWRGIAIVLIIIADVIFFSVIFVFQDNTLESIQKDPSLALPWAACLVTNKSDKNKCLAEAAKLVVNEATVIAVLILLACNGIWLLFLLGRVSMLTGWVDLVRGVILRKKRVEFVSADARAELGRRSKADTRAYEMLSRDSGKAEESGLMVTPISPVTPAAAKSPMSSAMTNGGSGRNTPDYFGSAGNAASPYQPPSRSFSSPRPPPQSWDRKVQHQDLAWDVQQTYARPTRHGGANGNGRAVGFKDVNPLGMNKI